MTARHTVVEHWLGIVPNNTQAGPTLEERVKFEGQRQPRRLEQTFLLSMAIWEERMADLKQSALEESHKNAISKELHDRRVVCWGATGSSEEGMGACQDRKTAAYDARMERAMEALENITDSKSAADFVREAKRRTARRSCTTESGSIRMESGVKRLEDDGMEAMPLQREGAIGGRS